MFFIFIAWQTLGGNLQGSYVIVTHWCALSNWGASKIGPSDVCKLGTVSRGIIIWGSKGQKSLILTLSWIICLQINSWRTVGFGVFKLGWNIISIHQWKSLDQRSVCQRWPGSGKEIPANDFGPVYGQKRKHGDLGYQEVEGQDQLTMRWQRVHYL